jgi:hypothetical protein
VHTWDEPGIKEIKATRSDGEELIVYVMVKANETPNSEPTPEPGPITPNPEPKPNPIITNSDPKPVKTDSDGDGVPDNNDKCPNIFGPKLNNGCPDDRKKIITPIPIPDRDTDGDGVLDNDDKCPNEKGTREYGGCLPPPPPVVFVPKSTSTICGLASQAALDDEKGASSGGSMSIKPSQDLILHEAKLVASGHGKIDISIEGGDIKNEVTITKNVNPGNNTIRMNDFKNTVLRAGKTYTLTYQTQGDIQVTQIKNAYASGCADSRVTIAGKNIFYDIIYKY